MLEPQKTGLWPWFMQRITAIILVIGLAVHFWVLHYGLERPLTFEKVAERLNSAGWILFDSILLLACLYHAFNGLYSILLDFNPNKETRKTAYIVLLSAGIILGVFGIVILIPSS